MPETVAVHDAALAAFGADEPDGHPVALRVDGSGALWTRQVQIATELTLAVSAARTAELTTSTVTNTLYKGVIVVLDWTSETDTVTLTPRIEGYSTLGDDWYVMLQGAALTAVGVTVLRVYPGAVASANLIADDWLPPSWRVVVAVGDADSATYSINAILLP